MESLEQILSICSAIYKAAENVKANKERCQRVTQRVKGLQELVLTIKQRGPGQISVTVANALRELCITLEEAKTLIMKFSQMKGFKSFLKSDSHEEKFCKVNERLTDNFQVLSGALQIEHGTILSKVYETVTGRKQDEEHCVGQATTSPTTPMPVSSPTNPMPVSSPTSPMPLLGIMPPMPVSSPTTPMPVSSPTSPMPVSGPTSPMPLPGIMPPMPVPSHTTSMPFPSTMPYMPMSSPTTPMPLPGPVLPLEMSSPTSPMSVPYMSPMPQFSSTTAMPPGRTMPPIRFPTTTAPWPVVATVSPIGFSSTMGPRPVYRIMAPAGATLAPVTFSTQTASVLRVVNKSYFT